LGQLQYFLDEFIPGLEQRGKRMDRKSTDKRAIEQMIDAQIRRIPAFDRKTQNLAGILCPDDLAMRHCAEADKMQSAP
jgi:hypothetical protein